MKIDIKKVLCPVDFSDNASHALKYAEAFAQAHGAELKVLHVIQADVLTMAADPMLPNFNAHVLEDYTSACKRQLSDIRGGVESSLGRNVEEELRTGSAFFEIIAAAREWSADLIVMGTHGRTGLAHMMMGSVAEKVVRKSPCPVLTVKHPEHEFVMP